MTNNLRFPGQCHDGEAGLYHNFYRDYDPITGRYLQRDSIGLGGVSNFYLYAGAAPMSYIDELGLMYRNGNDYRDRPGPNWPGCVKPIWAYGAIVGWKPCDDDDKPPRCDCPPCDSGDEKGGASSSGGSSRGSGSRNNSRPGAGDDWAAEKEAARFNQSHIAFREELDREKADRRPQCIANAWGFGAFGNGVRADNIAYGVFQNGAPGAIRHDAKRPGVRPSIGAAGRIVGGPVSALLVGSSIINTYFCY